MPGREMNQGTSQPNAEKEAVTAVAGGLRQGISCRGGFSSYRRLLPRLSPTKGTSQPNAEKEAVAAAAGGLRQSISCRGGFSSYRRFLPRLAPTKVEIAGNDKEDHKKKFGEKLQPGDHIVCERRWKVCPYQHHGILTENNLVIHLRGPSSSRSALSIPCNKCRYKPTEKGGLSLTCLDCFAQDELCYIIRYKTLVKWENVDSSTWERLVCTGAVFENISKKSYLEYHLDGKLYGYLKVSRKECSKYNIIYDPQIRLSKFTSAKPADEVIRTARLKLESEDTTETLGNCFSNYNLILNNCEHFAVYCMTNEPRSTQVEKVMGSWIRNGAKRVYGFPGRQLMKMKLRESLAMYASL